MFPTRRINALKLLQQQLPSYFDDYFNYMEIDEQDPTSKQIQRLKNILEFLNAYGKELNKIASQVTLEDCEKVPREFVQTYLALLQLRPEGKQYVLGVLSSLWSYFTRYSFTIERGQPLFYRNVFDEWKIVYNESYHKIIYAKSEVETILYSKPQLLDFLDYMANSYVTTLTTTKKVENWEKEKERNLALLAILIGTGATVEEIVNLTIRDIDMRKKGIWVVRNNEKEFIRFLEFTIPYIAPFVKERRERTDLDPSMPSLFVTMRKQPLGRNTIGHLTKNAGKAYGMVVTASILKDSHAAIRYQETGDLSRFSNARKFTSKQSDLLKQIV